jgi:peptide chain release factor 1
MPPTPTAAGFDLCELERRPGFVALRLSGRGALALRDSEPGGHRWQRVPPTEKRGRVHTSTITVCVLEAPDAEGAVIDLNDVDVEQYNGSGPGGQHRNKTANCVRAKHRPTGLEAKSESERSLTQNRRLALQALAARVLEHRRSTAAAARADVRRRQVGSGQRGDKVRTVREQDDVVTCERTGGKKRLRDYMKGDLSFARR